MPTTASLYPRARMGRAGTIGEDRYVLLAFTGGLRAFIPVVRFRSPLRVRVVIPCAVVRLSFARDNNESPLGVVFVNLEEDWLLINIAA